MPANGIFVQAPRELKDELRIEAIRQHKTLRQLVNEILATWMERERGSE
jgi:hypothetical protein